MTATKIPIGFIDLFDRDIPTWVVPFRILYGTIFLVSGILKLIDLPSFASTLNAFRLVPPALVSYVEFVIPIAEVVLGVSIICGLRTALMSSLTASMLAVFSGVVAEKLIEGAHISCGCFGPLSGETLTGVTLVRNIVLSVGGALLASVSTRVRWQSQRIESRPKRAGPEATASVMPTVWGVIHRAGAYCIVLLILGLFSLLEFQNIALKNRLAMVIDKQALTPGDIVPGFRATGLDSTQVQIRYDNASVRTLLLLFSVQCDACKDNLSCWDEIAHMAQMQQGWRVIGISLSSLENSRKFAGKRSFSYPILVTNDPAFRRDYKVYLTPLTLVVDSIGRVDVSWTGILNPETREEVIQVIRSGPTKLENYHKVSDFLDNPTKVSEKVP